jgi:hypothetical protein
MKNQCEEGKPRKAVIANLPTLSSELGGIRSCYV